MYAYFVEGNVVGYYSLSLLENKECEMNNLCVLPQTSASNYFVIYENFSFRRDFRGG